LVVGFLKEKLKKQKLSKSEEIIEAIPEIWKDVSSEKSQNTLCE
jgi:hypothetical protein